MELSSKNQIEFANEILALESRTPDIEKLIHLKNLIELVNHWTSGRSGLIGYLDEYMHEVISILRGEKDTGWKDEFKKKVDTELNITYPNQTAMQLPRKEQARFAKEILAILDNEKVNPRTISHLKSLSTLLVSWSGRDNGIAIDLNEYIGELYALKKNDGTGNVEWKDKYKKRVEEDIADIE